MFCREQAARFNDRQAEIAKLGATVVAIGNGNALMATDFVERFGIGFDVYTDPSRKSYAAAGMHRRFGINASSLSAAWRALKTGHVQGRTRGDAWQQGGVLVVDRDGAVHFAHADEAAGDHASIDDVITALKSIEAH